MTEFKPNRIRLILGFLLIISSFVVFYPTLQMGFFCWDDKAVALAPAIRDLTFKGIIDSFFSFHVGLYHPLTSISFMLDYYFGSGDPFPFHLTNLVLHASNTLLLFVLLNRLTGSFHISFLTCLFFAVHPLHIESVAWITSRKDLLFTFFLLLSVLFYIDYLDKKQKAVYYSLALLTAVFALLSKIQAISLPFIFILVDYYREKRLNTRRILVKVPFFLLCLLIGWLNILAQKGYGYTDYGLHFSFLRKTLLIAYSGSQYFFKTLIPYPLSVFYPYPFKPEGNVPLVTYFGPLLLIAFSLVLVFYHRRAGRLIIFGWLFFLINIIIVSVVSLNREAVMADRYAYVASAGILLMCSVYVNDLIRNYNKFRTLFTGLIIIYIGVLSWLTVQRSILWKDPVDLFTNDLLIYPTAEILLNSLGAQEVESGSNEIALRHLNEAISISPSFGQAYFNRGLTYAKMGKLANSVRDFSSALKINPDFIEALFARGTAYMKMNDLEKAFNDFTTVILLDRNHFGAFQNRAIVRGNMGDYNGAVRDLNAAIALNPGFAASYYLRGIALFNTGKDGCADLYKALSLGYREARKAIEYYCH